MKASEQAFQRLADANPLTETADHIPSREDARAFSASLEGGTVTSQDLTKQPSDPQQRSRQWLIAAAAFALVLLSGAALAFFSGDESTPAAPPPTTITSQTPSEIPVDEPAELANLRQAVNDGDAAAAADIHGEDGECDRFFTEGSETCLDWYSFLIGIGTNVSAANCMLESYGGEGSTSCEWTLGSTAHRALGIDSVHWEFTSVGADGWFTVYPDGNLFGGNPGLSQVDEDFWAAVTRTIEDELSTGPEGSTPPSLRVPATLNADLAVIVLEEARSFVRP